MAFGLFAVFSFVYPGVSYIHRVKLFSMKIIKYLLFFSAFFAVQNAIRAQVTFPKAAPSDERPGVFAFTNATIYLDYKTRLDGATLIIRDGKVEACGAKVVVPADAVVSDCSGKTIYPAFIDLYATDYGLPASPSAPGGGGGPGQRAPQPLSSKKGAYSWNEALRTEYNAADVFSTDAKAAEELRKLGFGAVLSHRADGISRGTGVFVSLADGREHESIIATQAAHFLSFRKGSSTQNYPASLMGCIALIRQTYLDGQWYKTEGYKEERNLSLDAWNAAQSLPQIFEASDKLDIMRIARIGTEFNVKYLIKTAGDEYQRLDAVKAAGQPLLVPLAFPENYEIKDPYDALNISLKDLKHWELAPGNPARLAGAGVNFALTTAGLKDKGKFWDNLRKAIESGLSEQAALQALTYNPASFINQYGKLGSLEPGKLANFIITTGNVFQKDSKILQNWTQGKVLEVTQPNYFTANPGYFGSYKVSVAQDNYTLLLKGKPEAPEAQIMKADSSKVKASISAQANGVVTLSFQPDSTSKGYVSLAGVVNAKGSWSGRGTLPDGSWVDWAAAFIAAAGPEKPGRQNVPAAAAVGDVIYPFTAFGRKEKPKAQTVLIQNTTVWTNEKEGILQNCDVLVTNGKIQKIGRQLPVQDDALLIDGSGKHLTAGIIDEHSHIAASRSINEGTQESSAEVRIGDVIDSEDIDIYRQLAGGVTSSHILHGSANPIGGQTQLLKMRWGVTPEEMKFQNWPGFIKFALGENVKQSNWGDNNRTRYPQTRMGVEQTYIDYFTRAKEYGQTAKSGKPYRRDIEMEALLEILESKRFITCHSYVQSEITMMMRVAEKFGFKLNTFTHILEGYKVADKMAKHGAGGSSFSDWWAYKYEVFEAIPHNAKMMADRGVVVAINSDDAEMARRLNQEAAKSVLYGGMKEEDAWKMVTLNPAKLLHVDDRVGSIKTGKDADLVLWNDNPLSIYARAEKTWVDGVLYFDRKEDADMQVQVEKERARIIQKMQAAPKGGEGRERPSAPKKYYDCESTEDEG